MVAILELDLPDASGLDLLRHAAGLPARPDIILLTERATLDSALAAIEPEAAGYLTKPFAPTRLGELVAGVMERRGLIQENERLGAALLTNSSRQQDVEEITRLGVVGYLVKADLSLQALGERVARIFEAG